MEVGGERVVNRSVLKITKAQINPTGRAKQETTEKFKMRLETGTLVENRSSLTLEI